MDRRQDLLRLIAQAADRRRDAEQSFRAILVSTREGGLPLSAMAKAAGLSVSRIHAILEEEHMQTHAPTPATGAAIDDVLIVPAELAYQDYLHHNAYVCQNGRSFRDVQRMGFYLRGTIAPHFPAIRAVEDEVPFSDEHAAKLRRTGSPIDLELAGLIERAPAYYRTEEGELHKVLFLTPPDDPETLKLSQPIKHRMRGRGSAWARNQRYISEEALRRNPQTTDDL